MEWLEVGTRCPSGECFRRILSRAVAGWHYAQKAPQHSSALGVLLLHAPRLLPPGRKNPACALLGHSAAQTGAEDMGLGDGGRHPGKGLTLHLPKGWSSTSAVGVPPEAPQSCSRLSSSGTHPGGLAAREPAKQTASPGGDGWRSAKAFLARQAQA